MDASFTHNKSLALEKYKFYLQKITNVVLSMHNTTRN